MIYMVKMLKSTLILILTLIKRKSGHFLRKNYKNPSFAAAWKGLVEIIQAYYFTISFSYFTNSFH